jgi:hypothetical protein
VLSGLRREYNGDAITSQSFAAIISRALVYTKVFINGKSFVRTGHTNDPRNISSKATPPLATTDTAAVDPDSQIHCILLGRCHTMSWREYEAAHMQPTPLPLESESAISSQITHTSPPKYRATQEAEYSSGACITVWVKRGSMGTTIKINAPCGL